MAQRLVVVGGGIVGASTALFAARDGWDVTLYERDRLGSHSSTAAAGVLSPPFFHDPSEPSDQQNTQALLSRRGYDFYPEFLEVLEGYTRVDVGYRVSGMWYLAFDEEDYEDKRTMAREMEKFNRSVRWADRDELLDELPFLNDAVEGGFLFEEEAQVVPNRLFDALEDALKESGIQVIQETEVHSIGGGENNPVVKTSSGDHPADAVLVAAGCWTPELLSNFSVDLPIYPRKGEMLRLKAPDLPDFPPVRRGDRFVLPRGNGVLVGSTVTEETEPLTRTHALRDLLDSAVDIIPRLEETHFKETWSGLRPYADMRGGPFLGQVPGGENVFFAAGHYKTGILQGPYTGKLMADYMADRDPEINVTRYGPDR